MEQVVYINGRPFVLRDVEQPFSNLEYTVGSFAEIFGASVGLVCEIVFLLPWCGCKELIYLHAFSFKEE